METTLHLCRRHKVLHIPAGWWPWPSATCCCLSVLEDGRLSALTQLGPKL